jgi:hypothetical protein
LFFIGFKRDIFIFNIPDLNADRVFMKIFLTGNLKSLGAIFLVLLLSFSSACKRGESEFSALEDPTFLQQENLTKAVKIESFSPTATPVIFLSSSERTFGVAVNSGSGEVEFDFLLDNLSIQKSTSPFLTIEAPSLSAGVHTLKVVAKNAMGSDEHIFNIIKNTPPAVSLNTNTSASISCSGDTFSLSVAATDADTDPITFSYILNGASNSPYLAGSSTLATASVVFTPNCSLAGANVVSIRATDARGEFTDYSIVVSVINTNSTSIDSYSPLTNPTVVLSTAATNFLISASGNPPLSYQWTITPGSTINSCNNQSSCSISGGDFTPGAYVTSCSGHRLCCNQCSERF